MFECPAWVSEHALERHDDDTILLDAMRLLRLGRCSILGHVDNSCYKTVLSHEVAPEAPVLLGQPVENWLFSSDPREPSSSPQPEHRRRRNSGPIVISSDSVEAHDAVGNEGLPGSSDGFEADHDGVMFGFEEVEEASEPDIEMAKFNDALPSDDSGNHETLLSDSNDNEVDADEGGEGVTMTDDGDFFASDSSTMEVDEFVDEVDDFVDEVDIFIGEWSSSVGSFDLEVEDNLFDATEGDTLCEGNCILSISRTALTCLFLDFALAREDVDETNVFFSSDGLGEEDRDSV